MWMDLPDTQENIRVLDKLTSHSMDGVTGFYAESETFLAAGLLCARVLATDLREF